MTVLNTRNAICVTGWWKPVAGSRCNGLPGRHGRHTLPRGSVRDPGLAFTHILILLVSASARVNTMTPSLWSLRSGTLRRRPLLGRRRVPDG